MRFHTDTMIGGSTFKASFLHQDSNSRYFSDLYWDDNAPANERMGNE